MSAQPASVMIIGAGASGVLAAAHVRRRMPGASIVLLSQGETGRGLAYGRAATEHLLNVPAAFMSAFPDAPEDFVAFARARGGSHDSGDRDGDGTAYLQRQMFGAYLRAVLEDAAVTVIAGEVRALAVDGTVRAHLADGRMLAAQAAILATGNPAPVVPPPLAVLPPRLLVADPWDPARFEDLTRDADVLLVGTGLTMVDQVISLRARGHAGRITAVSRRGQVPHAHLAHAHPEGAHPEGAHAHAALPDALPVTARGLLRALRHAAATQPWRGVVDGLRPHTVALWQAMPATERARFLRHGRAYWDVGRSRIAPAAAAAMDAARASGQLSVLAARIVAAEPDRPGAAVWVRGRSGEHRLTAGRVIVCTGPGAHTGAGLLCAMAAAGLVRDDPMGLGVDATTEGNVIGRDGGVSTRLFALGPPMRGVLWESIAVPDIARQAQALAAHVAGALRGRGLA